MPSPSVTTQDWFLWAAALVVLFPVVVVVLGELTGRLELAGSPVAGPLRLTRNVVVPSVVVVLFVRFVLERSGTSVLVRSLTTVVWLLGFAVLLSLLSAVVFAEADPDSWRGRAPRLFVDMARIVLVAVAGAVVVGVVWGVSLVGLFAALGVGGLALGLALQDTLASLMAGIALLSEKPFTVGDWIVVDGHEGLVTDINWRTVRLRTRQEDLVVIPNVVFGGQVIVNDSRPDRRHVEVVPLGFGYDDPPGEVRRVVEEVCRDCPGVLPDPPPEVRTVAFGDSAVEYELRVHLVDYDTMPRVRSVLLSRVWYAAQRHGLTIPFPMRTVEHHDAATLDARRAQDRERVRDRGLAALAITQAQSAAVASRCRVTQHTAGEVLLRRDERSPGLWVVVDGSAHATVDGPHGPAHVLSVGPGEFVGERGALGTTGNLLTVTAAEELRCVFVPAEAVRELTRENARFAADLERVVGTRRHLVAQSRSVRDATTSSEAAAARGPAAPTGGRAP